MQLNPEMAVLTLIRHGPRVTHDSVLAVLPTDVSGFACGDLPLGSDATSQAGQQLRHTLVYPPIPAFQALKHVAGSSKRFWTEQRCPGQGGFGIPGWSREIWIIRFSWNLVQRTFWGLFWFRWRNTSPEFHFRRF